VSGARLLLLLLAGLVASVGVACGSESSAEVSADDVPTLQLSSDAFESGAEIPRRFTCDAADVSPRLFWTAVGDGRELALIVDDPDAGGFVHWVAYGIPISARELPEDAEEGDQGVPGTNDFGNTGYGGPCPPQGSGPHQYDLTLFSLSEPVDLAPGATAAELRRAIDGTVLQEARYSGFYER